TFTYHLRILHEEPADAKLVGITVWEIAGDSIIYNSVLNEVTPTWDAVAAADEPDEEGRESLLSLVAQSKSIKAREFIEDSFDNVPWKFRMDLLFESSKNTETPPWTTQLWITERLSGTNAIAGIQSEGRVFYTTQEFTDSFFKLTFSRFDPGAEPEPENVPLHTAPVLEPEPAEPSQ
ncbi:MAG: hypothetical protein O7C75_04355, partial [Verrucomicrobia bacterium]|nr:hypothetical protein [Verrucomicrobiota bacterium]